MTPNALNMHTTLLKSLQKHCQMVFSRLWSMTIFIPAENTRHSEKHGQNSELKCMVMHLNGEDVQFTDFMRKVAKSIH
jgi:hypothetical protein